MAIAVRIDNSAPIGAGNPDGSATFPLSTLITPFPMNAAYYPSSSGNVANATALAYFVGAPGKYNYVSGIHITGLGATAASTVLFTISGIGTIFTYIIPVPAGVTTSLFPNTGGLFIIFPSPLQSTAVNTQINASLPALGAGNTNACVNMWGYQL
jgi:hypothetical protein